MYREDHERVRDEMRLTSGHVFPIPLTLVREPSPAIHLHYNVALRNAKNELLAIMNIQQIYEWII
jgi:sulfate adenylyltransferase